jgi:endonuclease III
VSGPDANRIVDALIDRHGRTYAEDAGIALRDTPSPLFRLLTLALLLSARIKAHIAVAAARALSDAGWTTARRMADSTWEDRVRALNRSGYARYDERTATMLGDTAELVLESYHGDLRELRERSERDPDAERRALQQFSGIGPVGAAIFSREAQLVWSEMYPFADERALRAAARLGLADDVEALRCIASTPEALTRLVAALVRCGIAGDHDEILAAAACR